MMDFRQIFISRKSLIFSTVVLGSVLLVLLFTNNKPIPTSTQNIEQNTTVNAQDNVSQAITCPNTTKLFYTVTLKRKPNTSEPKLYSKDEKYRDSHIGDYLIDALGLGDPDQIKNEAVPFGASRYSTYEDFFSTLFRDTREAYEFNSSYFITLKEDIPPLDFSKIHDHESFTVAVVIGEQTLFPYITNADYCEVDSDCTIRIEDCGQGAFNYYSDVGPSAWGCEVPYYPDEDQQWLGWQEGKKFVEESCEEKGFSRGYLEFMYSDAVCQRNTCVPKEKSISGFHCSP